MEITVDGKTAGACTADMAVTTYELNLGPIPDEVVLVFNGEDRRKIAVEPL